MEEGGTCIGAGLQVDIQGSLFDLAAHRDGLGFVYGLLGVVAVDLHLLGIAVDVLVDNHEVALGVAALEDRGGVHADADHAIGDSFVEGFFDFFLGHLLPAALDGVLVIDDAAGLGLGRHILAGAARQDSRNGRQQEHTDQHQPEVGRQGFAKVLLSAFQHGIFLLGVLGVLGTRLRRR